MSAAELAFVATVPRGLADLLAAELRSVGALHTRERSAGVLFSGTLETGYRACLWSRTASRVLLQLTEFEAASADEFYRQVRRFRLERAHRPGAHDRLRVHRRTSDHHP